MIKRVLLITALASAVAYPAAAQGPPADPPSDPPTEPAEPEDPTTRAFELNEAGLQAFEDGRFADAATAFAQAWTYSRDETLRKNEAIAWFRAGECEQSVEAGNKFLLNTDIPRPDRVLVNSLIANCKAEFARKAIDATDLDLADSLLTEAEALETDAVAADRLAAVRVDLAAARQAAEEAKPPPEPEIRTVYVPTEEPDPPYVGYGLMAGGGALIVGTIVYHFIAMSWQRKFYRIAEDRNEGSEEKFNGLRDRVHVARIAVPIMYSVGVLTTGAGVTLSFFVEPSAPAASGESSDSAPMTFGVRGTFR